MSQHFDSRAYRAAISGDPLPCNCDSCVERYRAAKAAIEAAERTRARDIALIKAQKAAHALACERLLEWKKDAGLTYADIGKRLGISGGRVQQMFKRRISTVHIVALSEMSGIPVCELAPVAETVGYWDRLQRARQA